MTPVVDTLRASCETWTGVSFAFSFVPPVVLNIPEFQNAVCARLGLSDRVGLAIVGTASIGDCGGA